MRLVSWKSNVFWFLGSLDRGGYECIRSPSSGVYFSGHLTYGQSSRRISDRGIQHRAKNDLLFASMPHDSIPRNAASSFRQFALLYRDYVHSHLSIAVHVDLVLDQSTMCSRIKIALLHPHTHRH